MINKIIGQYKILRQIGEGGMAVVYEGFHVRLGKRVAIKILNEELVRKSSIRQRFENEARIMAELNHPNIVNIFDYIEEGNLLAIVMELLEGISLKDYLKQKGALSKEESIQIFLQVLEAFDLAHQKGIIHRDIKPSNIFLENKNNNVKILDFGIAKLLSSDHSKTQHGAQMGSPLYMSPEQVKDAKDVDNLSDIYSLGVVLFHMLNGKPPYSDTTLSRFDIFNKIVYEKTPPLNKYPELDKIIQKATQKEKNKRYLTCFDFANDLKKAMQDDSNGNNFNDNRIEDKIHLSSSSINTELVSKDDNERIIIKEKKSSNLWFFYLLLFLILGGGSYLGYLYLNRFDKKGKNKIEQNVSLKKDKEKKQETSYRDIKKETIKPFEKLISDPIDDIIINDIFQNKNSDILAVGTTIFGDNDNNADFIIYKMDKFGNFVGLKRIYGGTKWDEGKRITSINNHFFVGGNTRSKGNGKKDLWIIKTDDKLNKIDDFVYGDTNDDDLKTMFVSEENIVIGSINKSRSKGSIPHILVIDKNGNILKELFVKKSENYDYKIFDAVLNGNNYVFVGEIIDENQDKKIWILNTDSDLNILWEKIYDFGFTAKSVINDNKDNLVIMGSKSEDGLEEFLIKLNSEGQMLWNKPKVFYLNGSFASLQDFIVFKDRSYIALFNIYDNEGKSTTLLAKINEDGSLKNKYINKDSSSLEGKYIYRDSDGWLLLVLQSENYNGKKTSIIKKINIENL